MIFLKKIQKEICLYFIRNIKKYLQLKNNLKEILLYFILPPSFDTILQDLFELNMDAVQFD